MNTLCSFLVWLLNLKSISCFVQSIPSVIQRCNQDDVEKGSFIMQIIREVSLKACPYYTVCTGFYMTKQIPASNSIRGIHSIPKQKDFLIYPGLFEIISFIHFYLHG